LQQQLGWQATKRAMARTARAMATATKRVMATDGDNLDNDYCKEDDRHLTVETRGTAQRTRPLVLQLERGDDGDGARDMAACVTTGERGIMVAMGHGICVCFCVSGETTKNKEERKILNVTYR
jgi:hypothetical protein